MQFNFEKLEVYQDGIEFADKKYNITKPIPKSEEFIKKIATSQTTANIQ